MIDSMVLDKLRKMTIVYLWASSMIATSSIANIEVWSRLIASFNLITVHIALKGRHLLSVVVAHHLVETWSVARWLDNTREHIKARWKRHHATELMVTSLSLTPAMLLRGVIGHHWILVNRYLCWRHLLVADYWVYKLWWLVGGLLMVGWYAYLLLTAENLR